MFIDAPHDITRAYLALEDLETFVIRYTDLITKVVIETNDTAERLKTENKETRDQVLGGLLERINKLVLGKTPEDYRPWPLATITPMHTGLAYRNGLIKLLAYDEININQLVDFVNAVYFPTLDLTELKKVVLERGGRAHPNERATHDLVLNLAHQVTMLATRNALFMPKPTETEEEA